MTQLSSTRGVHAAGGAAARIFAAATAAVVVVSLLGLSTPFCAEATSAPAMMQTRTVTWLSTDEQPDFVEAFEQDGLTYSLVGTEIMQLESQFGTVPAQRSVTVPCEPVELDAARNSFVPSLDVEEDGYAGSIPLAQVTYAPVYAQRSWEVNELRDFAGLPSNDAIQIAAELSFTNPETQNDLVLRLASLSWSIDARDANGLPSSYTAHALYRGADTASALDHYDVTAFYEGDVQATEPVITYQATLSYRAPAAEAPGGVDDSDGLPLAAIAAAAAAVAAAAAAFGVFFWRRRRDVRVCRVEGSAREGVSAGQECKGDSDVLNGCQQGSQGGQESNAARETLKVIARVSSKRAKDGALVVELPPHLDVAAQRYALMLAPHKADGGVLNVVQCGRLVAATRADSIVYL